MFQGGRVSLNSLTIEEAEDRHPDLVRGQIWHGSSYKYDYYCEAHEIYKQSFGNHHRGSGCPRCRNSKMEVAVDGWLQSRQNSDFIRTMIDFCRDSYPLPFDFGSVIHKVLIECQGEHHYMPVNFSGKYKVKKARRESNRNQPSRRY